MERKKAEGKKARDDKEAVHEMLFAAFEKHQYYNIKDLVNITRQPITYLKEILKDVCNYNLKNPHKNMWELKPEYRHYKESAEGSAAASGSADNKDDTSDEDWSPYTSNTLYYQRVYIYTLWYYYILTIFFVSCIDWFP